MFQQTKINVKTKKLKINPDWPFVLLISVSDGFIDFGKDRFYQNFEEFTYCISRDLEEIQATGEWTARIYHFPPNEGVLKSSTDVISPDKDKLILEYNYKSPQFKGIDFKPELKRVDFLYFKIEREKLDWIHGPSGTHPLIELEVHSLLYKFSQKN